MNTFERQKWEQMQARGRASFVWREGVIRRGVVSGGLFGICWLLWALVRHRLDAREAFAIGAMAAAIALCVGLVSGLALWRKWQHRYVSGIDHVA